MNYTETEDKVIKFATKKHDGQTRWDRNIPYITHPIAVAKNVHDYFQNRKDTLKKTVADYWICRYIAYLHDVIEDTDTTYDEIRDLFPVETAEDERIRDLVLEGVALLTKTPDITYMEYILRIPMSWHATVVKIADITHNLTDLKGKKRDKYELARYILEGE